MALIKCSECSRDISDQAASCPNCGAPVTVREDTPRAPAGPSLDNGTFIATREQMAALASSAVLACGYRIDSSDDSAGTLTFTTGMTMGSWSGVSGTVIYREVQPYRFEATGSAKQNVKGGQMLALDLFGEAESKVQSVIAEMKRQAGTGKITDPNAQSDANTGTGCALLLIASGVTSSLWFISNLA